MHLYAFRGFDEEGSTRVIKYYDPSEVDARIAKLEKALREMADRKSFHTIQEMRQIASEALGL